MRASRSVSITHMDIKVFGFAGTRRRPVFGCQNPGLRNAKGANGANEQHKGPREQDPWGLPRRQPAPSRVRQGQSHDGFYMAGKHKGGWAPNHSMFCESPCFRLVPGPNAVGHTPDPVQLYRINFFPSAYPERIFAGQMFEFPFLYMKMFVRSTYGLTIDGFVAALAWQPHASMCTFFFL